MTRQLLVDLGLVEVQAGVLWHFIESFRVGGHCVSELWTGGW